MKLLSIIGIILMSFGEVFAQADEPAINPDTTYWAQSFSVGLNLNQSTFSGNWKGGGVNSFALGPTLSATANYEKGAMTFDNEIELLYGIIKQEGRDTRKSDDRIFLDSKVGYKLSQNWAAYFSGNFISQFTYGYDYANEERTLTSSFLSPGYLTGSLGLEYDPNDQFSLRIGPFSPRLTFMNDQSIHENVPGNYGVPIGNSLRTEWLALQVYATLNVDISEDFNIKSRYQMFANYETLSFDSIDHRLDLTLTASITRLINVTFRSVNLYDLDQDPGIQYSTGISLGVSFKMGS